MITDVSSAEDTELSSLSSIGRPLITDIFRITNLFHMITDVFGITNLFHMITDIFGVTDIFRITNLFHAIIDASSVDDNEPSSLSSIHNESILCDNRCI